jgi:hypothetical protein
MAAAATRRDPSARGRHADALVSCAAPTSRSTCCACGRGIAQGAPRWGLKYAGGPLTQEHVVPLYGTHPMWSWFHHECGFAFERRSELLSRNPEWRAAATCHLCGTDCDRDPEELRVRCGGKAPARRGDKVVHHAFHVACARVALGEEALPRARLVGAQPIYGGLGWTQLTSAEQQLVLRALGEKEGEREKEGECECEQAPEQECGTQHIVTGTPRIKVKASGGGGAGHRSEDERPAAGRASSSSGGGNVKRRVAPARSPAPTAAGSKRARRGGNA